MRQTLQGKKVQVETRRSRQYPKGDVRPSVRRYRPSPLNKSALHRFRVAFWFCGLTFVAVGCIRLFQGQFAYISISGAIFSLFLIVLGLFFIAIAVLVLWRPRTRPD